MKQNKSSIEIIGRITGKVYSQEGLTRKQRIMNKIIIKLKGTEMFKPMFEKFYTLGDLVKEDYQENTICMPGLTALAMRSCGDFTYTNKIDRALLGDGIGIPNMTDVAMFNEVYRNPIASYSFTANKAYLTCFFDVNEVGGTFTEFGTMIDNLLLWTHVNVDWTKGLSQVMVISAEYEYKPKTV